MAITNSDDHLRNHAFIFTKKGWILSPLFDVNPVPYGDELSLNVNDDDNRINLELALSVATKFGISSSLALNYAKEITATIKENWEKVASSYNLSRKEQLDMKPAFSLCYA